jgi:hypothetical protein
VSGQPVKFRSPTLKALFASAVAQGWKWRRGGSHVLIFPPDGSPAIALSTTAYDGKMNLDLVARAKRHGLKWKER